MFSETGMAHHVPHFHAYAQDEAAVFSISPVELIAGTLPQKQRRLVEAWAELHQAELIADWQLLHAGRAAVPIEPLSKMGIPVTHLISSVQDFEIIAAYTLRVAFDDGTEQIINFEPVLRGELYGPFRDADLFRRVHLDLRLTRLRGRTEPTSTPRYFTSGRTVRRLSSRWHRVGRRCEPDCGANHGSVPSFLPGSVVELDQRRFPYGSEGTWDFQKEP